MKLFGCICTHRSPSAEALLHEHSNPCHHDGGTGRTPERLLFFSPYSNKILGTGASIFREREIWTHYHYKCCRTCVCVYRHSSPTTIHMKAYRQPRTVKLGHRTPVLKQHQDVLFILCSWANCLHQFPLRYSKNQVYEQTDLYPCIG